MDIYIYIYLSLSLCLSLSLSLPLCRGRSIEGDLEFGIQPKAGLRVKGAPSPSGPSPEDPELPQGKDIRWKLAMPSMSLWYQRFANLSGSRPLREIEQPGESKASQRGHEVAKCKLSLPKNILTLSACFAIAKTMNLTLYLASLSTNPQPPTTCQPSSQITLSRRAPAAVHETSPVGFYPQDWRQSRETCLNVPTQSDLSFRPPYFFQLEKCGRSANSTCILTADAPYRMPRPTARQPL